MPRPPGPGRGIWWTSRGLAEPVSANTPSPPLPWLAAMSDTKDQRPSAATTTPNGSPGTADSAASPAGSCFPAAVAVLHQGTAPDATGLAGAGRGAGAACGGLEVQAVSASASTATTA